MAGPRKPIPKMKLEDLAPPPFRSLPTPEPKRLVRDLALIASQLLWSRGELRYTTPAWLRRNIQVTDRPRPQSHQ